MSILLILLYSIFYVRIPYSILATGGWRTCTRPAVKKFRAICVPTVAQRLQKKRKKREKKRKKRKEKMKPPPRAMYVHVSLFVRNVRIVINQDQGRVE